MQQEDDDDDELLLLLLLREHDETGDVCRGRGMLLGQECTEGLEHVVVVDVVVRVVEVDLDLMRRLLRMRIGLESDSAEG